MKKLNKKQYKIIGVFVIVVALVATGVTGTLGYQSFITNTKAQGVSEFKALSCEKYNNDKVSWLECDL